MTRVKLRHPLAIGWARWRRGTSTSRSSPPSTASRAPTRAAARCTRRARGARARSPPRRAPAELSRAFHLQGEPVAALIRFSNASGNPEADDGASARRAGSRSSSARATARRPTSSRPRRPAFVTRTPEDFLELMRLRRPDPETGQPDFEKLGAWLGEHPETQTGDPVHARRRAAGELRDRRLLLAAHLLARRRRPASGRRSATAGSRRRASSASPTTRPRSAGRDYLHDELAERLAARARSRSSSACSCPADDDPLDDATALWPDDREQVVAGTARDRARGRRPRARRPHRRLRPAAARRRGRALRRPDPARAPQAYSVSAYRRWGDRRGRPGE